MVCWYMARAEMGLGLAVILVGLALAICRRAGTRQGLYIGLAAMVLPALLYPTVLIGVCPGASMPCRIGTLPALMIESCLLGIFAVSAAKRNAIRARRSQRA
jgi:hypothetical protein